MMIIIQYSICIHFEIFVISFNYVGIKMIPDVTTVVRSRSNIYRSIDL